MRTGRLLPLIVSAALVVVLAAALLSRAIPLGVPGEWEWLRVRGGPAAIDVILAGLGVAAYAIFSGVGMAALMARASLAREALAVVALLAASVVVQAVAQSGAPEGYGLEKWVIAIEDRGASGYFTVAKNEVHDPARFLADYPTWVRGQDALHIGTHPPGLILCEALLLRAMGRSPRAAKFVERHAPEAVVRAFRVYGQEHPMTPADRATFALTGFLTLLACAATVVPLYLLARASLPAPLSWSAAALWPLVPSAVLFQPTADTAFPLLSTSALAFAAHSGCRASLRRRLVLAFLSGLTLGVGMQFTLAFLAVGLVVALVLAGDRESSRREKLLAVLATGVGFLALTLSVWTVTGANPFVIWWWNQKNHARFYSEFIRSYRAWVVVNPVELGVALGLPISVWAGMAVGWPRAVPRVSVATAVVLAFLTLSGKNLSEVARLWLPFMPSLLVAAATAIGKAGAGPKSVAATVALVGAQTLALEATIQVVYPL